MWSSRACVALNRVASASRLGARGSQSRVAAHTATSGRLWMSSLSGPAIDRRALLIGGAGMAAAASFPRAVRAGTAPIRDINLTAAPGRVSLVGPAHPATSVWCYGNRIPGPEIRLRQGERVRMAVHNQLPEDTTVHWHGIRLPNAMDGVPGLTQPPIKPGESFTYEFTPPDAGTFWYHPHADSLQQLG